MHPTKKMHFHLGHIVVLCWSILLSCNTSEDKKTDISDSNKKMVATLADVAQKMNVGKNRYASAARLASLDSVINTTKDLVVKGNTLVTKAMVLLEAGREQDAVDLYERIVTALKDNPDYVASVRPFMGLAYLRLAERTNCINQHGGDVCVMPIKGGGVHQDKNPARKAVEILHWYQSIGKIQGKRR